MLDKSDVMTYATVLIAIIVVLGGGVAIVIRPDMSEKILPLMTLVLGFFFSTGNFRTGMILGQQTANLNQSNPK